MKVRIHFTHGDHEDFIDLEGDSVEEIRLLANKEMDKRDPDNKWSEVLEA